MLTLEDTKNPDAINQILCKKMDALRRYPMDREMTEIMVKLCLIPRGEMKMSDEEKPHLVQLIDKRIKYCHTFKIADERLLLFIAMIAGSAGTAVMYIWYIQSWCFKHNVVELNMENFVNIFPMGFFAKEDLQSVWESQKVASDDGRGARNLVDIASAGESIQFKQENTSNG